MQLNAILKEPMQISINIILFPQGKRTTQNQAKRPLCRLIQIPHTHTSAPRPPLSGTPPSAPPPRTPTPEPHSEAPLRPLYVCAQNFCEARFSRCARVRSASPWAPAKDPHPGGFQWTFPHQIPDIWPQHSRTHTHTQKGPGRGRGRGAIGKCVPAYGFRRAANSTERPNSGMSQFLHCAWSPHVSILYAEPHYQHTHFSCGH